MQNQFIGSNPVYAQRRMYENKYASSRVNLLLVFAFTVINIILLATGSFTYILFSASIPYFIAETGYLLCGKFPPEVYEGELAGVAILEPSASIVFIIIALLVSCLYLVCWILSKKRPGWLVASIVIFALDTLAMFALYGLSFDNILDILFHAWVIWSLVSGIKANNALRALPPVEQIAPEMAEGYFTVEPNAPAESSAETSEAFTESSNESPVENSDTPNSDNNE